VAISALHFKVATPKSWLATTGVGVAGQRILPCGGNLHKFLSSETKNLGVS